MVCGLVPKKGGSMGLVGATQELVQQFFSPPPFSSFSLLLLLLLLLVRISFFTDYWFKKKTGTPSQNVYGH